MKTHYLAVLINLLLMTGYASAQSFQDELPKIMQDCSRWVSSGKVNSFKIPWIHIYDSEDRNDIANSKWQLFVHPNFPVTLLLKNVIYKKNTELRTPYWNLLTCKIRERNPTRSTLSYRLRRYELNGSWDGVKPLKKDIAENAILDWSKKSQEANRLQDWTYDENPGMHRRNSTLINCYSKPYQIIKLFVDGVLDRPKEKYPVWQINFVNPHPDAKLPCAGS